MHDCAAPTDTSTDAALLRYVRCAAYLAGLNDMLTIVMMQTRPDTYCPRAAGLPIDELRELALGWYAGHPRERGRPARAAMLSALLGAFRCDMPSVPVPDSLR